MRIPASLAPICGALSLIAFANPVVAADAPSQDDKVAATRCLALAYEIDDMVEQMLDDKDALKKKGGEKPTPEQAKEIQQLDEDSLTFSVMGTNLLMYFSEASPPDEEVELDMALLDGDEMSNEFDNCDALMDKIDAAKGTKAN